MSGVSTWRERVRAALRSGRGCGEAGTVFEEGLEGGADRGLLGDVEVDELVEGGVVGFGRLVGGFKG